MKLLVTLLFTLFAVGCSGGSSDSSPTPEPTTKSDQFTEHAPTGKSSITETYTVGDRIKIDIASGNYNPGTRIPATAQAAIVFQDKDEQLVFLIAERVLTYEETLEQREVDRVDLSQLIPDEYLENGFIIPGNYIWQFIISTENDSDFSNNTLTVNITVLKSTKSDQFIEHAETEESEVSETFTSGDEVTINIRSGNLNQGTYIPDTVGLTTKFWDLKNGVPVLVQAWFYLLNDDGADPDVIGVETIDLAAFTPAAYLQDGLIIPGRYKWEFTVSFHNDSDPFNNSLTAIAVVLESNNS